MKKLTTLEGDELGGLTTILRKAKHVAIDTTRFTKNVATGNWGAAGRAVGNATKQVATGRASASAAIRETVESAPAQKKTTSPLKVIAFCVGGYLLFRRLSA